MTASLDTLAPSRPLPDVYPGWDVQTKAMAPGVVPVGALRDGSVTMLASEYGYAIPGVLTSATGETPAHKGEEAFPPIHIEQSVIGGKSEKGLGSFEVQMAWCPSSPESKPRAVVYLGLGAAGWLIPRVVQQLERRGMKDIMVVGDIPSQDGPTKQEQLKEFTADAMSLVMAQIHERFDADESYAPVVAGESKAAAILLEAARKNPDLFKGKRLLIQPFGLTQQSMGEFIWGMSRAGLHPEQKAPAAKKTVANIGHIALGLPVLPTELLPEQGPESTLTRIGRRIGRVVLAPFKMIKMIMQLEAGLAYNGVQEFWRQYNEVGPDGLRVIAGVDDTVFRVGKLAVNLPVGAVRMSYNPHITMASDSGSEALFQALQEAFGEPTTLLEPSRAWVQDLKEQKARQTARDYEVAYAAAGELLFQFGIATQSDDDSPQAKARPQARAGH